MNHFATRLVAIFLPVVAAGALAFGLSAAPAEASITGDCKDVELTFVNGTSGKIDIPSSGHQMKNPGSLEGWNSLTLGAAKGNLAAGGSWSNTKTLSIKCVTDAEFKFKWSDSRGDHVENFSSVNIADKKATFTLK